MFQVHGPELPTSSAPTKTSSKSTESKTNWFSAFDSIGAVNNDSSTNRSTHPRLSGRIGFVCLSLRSPKMELAEMPSLCLVVIMLLGFKHTQPPFGSVPGLTSDHNLIVKENLSYCLWGKPPTFVGLNNAPLAVQVCDLNRESLATNFGTYEARRGTRTSSLTHHRLPSVPPRSGKGFANLSSLAKGCG